MNLVRSTVLTLALSMAAAALGAWGGAQYVVRHAPHAVSLDQTVHEELHLTPDQQRRIAGVEREHAARRQAYEAEMRAANADLARAFEAQHAYTPEVEAAVERFHRAMGGLQKETMVHVLAMRAVLTPQQTARFDETVVRSLTQEPR